MCVGVCVMIIKEIHNYSMNIQLNDIKLSVRVVVMERSILGMERIFVKLTVKIRNMFSFT